jgi:hypothetical protein
MRIIFAAFIDDAAILFLLSVATFSMILSAAIALYAAISLIFAIAVSLR